MPKMQVYLPAALYEKVKRESERLNVSGILQQALGERLAELARQDALASAVAAHVAVSGHFTDGELDHQAAADRASTKFPSARKKRSGAT